MLYNVLDYLEYNTEHLPNKAAIVDDKSEYTYRQVNQIAKRIGCALSKRISRGKPVAVFMDKNAESVCAFFGIVYGGGFYSLFNPELPEFRLQQMQKVLNPAIIITESSLYDKALELFSDTEVLVFSELIHESEEPETAIDSILKQIRNTMIDTDPLYLNFTSGSTGVPKGILVGHRSVIDFISCFTELFSIGSEDVIANQAPFDFDVSVKDIYSAVKTGATLVVIPRMMFSKPVLLLDFLCEKKVTTMIWAVSALCLISTFHGLDYKTPETIRKVLFSGEVMPEKHLKSWRSHLPNAMFVNLYGPTEITCNCTYHILAPEGDYSNGIPIGIPFPNEDVFLLDEQNQKISATEVPGEICVRGTALALGYYANPEQNAVHFVQNPLNPYYPELIYRTGDLGKLNADGEFVFCGRKDFQIKHMGHRIELEEVERAISAVDGVERCCCIFDEKKSKLRGFYLGSIEKEELHNRLVQTLPAFMVPGLLRRLDDMPLNKNGKIDRKKLSELTGGN